MSGCFDNIHCAECMDLGEKRNSLAAIAGGILFFVGWWIIVDVMATPNTSGNPFNGWYYVIGGVGTFSMFMINAISNSQVRGDAMSEGLLGTRGSRLWLLLGFILGFGSLIASIWVMFQTYVITEDNKNVWPGIALFLQNFFIFLGSLIYKFGRTEDLWS